MGDPLPRGVAIPNVRDQLFLAAERVLLRDGPSGLSSRAVTTEAGYAKGILHNHFSDFDQFLAEFAVDRLRDVADDAAALPARAGKGTVVGNLTEATLSVFGPLTLAIAGLIVSRPGVLARVQEQSAAGAPNLQQIEATFSTYLEAERALGRVTVEADSETLALMLVGTAHHLFFTSRASKTQLPRRLRKIVSTLLGA
jgi:AcrR family transcriptional regulator